MSDTQNKDPERLSLEEDPEIRLIMEEIEAEAETAAAKDGSLPSFNRIAYLMKTTASIISTIHQATRNPREARFIAYCAKDAVYHWYPPEAKRDGK